MRAAVLLAFAVGLAAASITPNPDSWELPPAAPNYAYFAQGLLGDGALSTLVTIRDPLSSSVAQYNTSLFAFSASGGLVPLNYIELSDGHCHSTMIADILVCDFQSSAAGVTQFYQLAVQAGSGGANRVVVRDQLTAPFAGRFATVPPVLVDATQRLVMMQWTTTPTGALDLNMWELDRTNATGAGLELIARGSIPGSALGGFVQSFAVTAAGDQLLVTAHGFTLVYTFPALALVSNTTWPTPGYGVPYAVQTAGADTGVLIANTNAKLSYATVDVRTGTPTGPTLADPTSSFYSYGLGLASSSSSAVQGYGPCAYVSSYTNGGGGATYSTLSQVRMPTAGTAAATLEAQITLGAFNAGTLVANAQYVFVISNEIMYRYIAKC